MKVLNAVGLGAGFTGGAFLGLLINFPREVVQLKLNCLGAGITGKILNYPVSYISSSASEKLSQVSDHFFSFGTNWGYIDVKNWLYEKEVPPPIVNSDKTTTTLIAAASLAVVLGSIAVVKVFGKNAEKIAQNVDAVQNIGSEHVEKRVE